MGQWPYMGFFHRGSLLSLLSLLSFTYTTEIGVVVGAKLLFLLYILF